MKCKTNKLILLCVLLKLSFSCYAAKVDTIKISSSNLLKDTKAVIITPEGYENLKELPVVYLLHGYGGNYANFVSYIPELKEDVDQYKFVVVCPDGGKSGWYIDSPLQKKSRYDSYIAEELIPYVDRVYHTKKDKSGRAITGLSMGGHGAISLAFRHPELFGAVGSMSGGLDIRPFSKNWDLPKILGEKESNAENWERFTVINLIDSLDSKPPKIITDCGVDDFFYQVNLNFHQRLLEKKIPHDFISRPGSHNWGYWRNALKYQLMFMHQFFQIINKSFYNQDEIFINRSFCFFVKL